MKKIVLSTLILTAISLYQAEYNPAKALSGENSQKPNISIVTTPVVEQSSQSKPLKLKTTIVTKKLEKVEVMPNLELKKDKRDIELTSDVDKILKEMDIDDTDPGADMPANSVETIYKPAKKNFMWIAFSIILFLILLFALLMKAMQVAKNRFEEEKKEGLSKEELFLDEIEKAQKTTKKKPRSLSDILGGGHHKEKHISKAYFEDEFDKDDEDFEFMVEEVVLVEENKPTPKEPKESKKAAKSKPAPGEQKPEKIEDVVPESKPEPLAIKEEKKDNDIIDSFEVDENLKFILSNKNNEVNLICQLNNLDISIMKLDKAQKFNKVRKIDSKPGRDVYMVKLDSWRGLVEVKEDSVKYLMDI